MHSHTTPFPTGTAMSQRANKAKASAYQQRSLVSIAAPLEPDSDPEFNAGTFVYETKKWGKRVRRPSPPMSPRKFRKRRSDILNHAGPSTSSKKRPRGAEAPKTNPLLEYFGDDLDLHSASEEDEPREESPEPDDEISEPDSDKEVETEGPALSRNLIAFPKSSKAGTPAPGGTPVVDSETESESEAEPVAQPLKRKSLLSPQAFPPENRAKTPPPEDDSETETESDDELVKVALSTAFSSSSGST
ncbi:hypothetical protein BS17DRAFT_318741 [Gyrodon lividus]|nr:hypothetical protein BS17DRAFT_318741 [Gyrodon lividus]